MASFELFSHGQAHNGPTTWQPHSHEQIADVAAKHVACPHTQRQQSDQETGNAASSSTSVFESNLIAASDCEHFRASYTAKVEDTSFNHDHTIATHQRQRCRDEAGADHHG
jgi:hypothetical protein